MGDNTLSFAQLFLQFIEFVWPVHRVAQWQRGVLYVCGRYWRTVGPGIYPLPWWFLTIHVIDMVPQTLTCTVETITTRDGGTLTYGPQMEIEVFDAALANNSVMDHEQKARLDAWGILSDTLSELPESRLEPEARRRMVTTCLKAINAKLGTYGMRCTDIAFLTWVRNMRNMRLFVGV